MITPENLQEVIKMIDLNDRNHIKRSNSEYAVLTLVSFNAGSYVTVTTIDIPSLCQEDLDNGAHLCHVSYLKDKLKEIYG